VVDHTTQRGLWQRVANLPAAYAACELFSRRDALALPRWREEA
jgi:hypothetical protein